MVRIPAGFHPPAQSGPGGIQSTLRRIVPASILTYNKSVTVPLQPGQAQTILAATTTYSTPAVVQEAANFIANSAATSVTVTLGTATTAGHCLVAAVVTTNATANASVSSVTIGGSADNWASAYVNGGPSTAAICSFWADPDCEGGQTSVVVSFSGGTGNIWAYVYVYEVSGIVSASPLDQSAGNSSLVSSSSWSSGSTGTTVQASEIAIGLGYNGSATGLTGPASPWVNEAVQGSSPVAISGYQVLTAETTVTYSGTANASGHWAAAVITLEAASSSTSAGGTVTIGPTGTGTIWYPTQVVVSTTTGILDTSTFQLYIGPVGVPITLVGTLFPGGAGTIALAIPYLAPGLYLIGVWTGGHAGDVAALNVVGTMTALSQ